MRAAGFESDYYVEAARRQEERRRRLGSVRSRVRRPYFALVALASTVVVLDAFGVLDALPKRVAVVLIAVALILLLLDGAPSILGKLRNRVGQPLLEGFRLLREHRTRRSDEGI
jgi:hypothetical protein